MDSRGANGVSFEGAFQSKQGEAFWGQPRLCGAGRLQPPALRFSRHWRVLAASHHPGTVTMALYDAVPLCLHAVHVHTPL